MCVSERVCAKGSENRDPKTGESEREGRSVTLSGFVNSWLAWRTVKKGSQKLLPPPSYRQKRECEGGSIKSHPLPPHQPSNAERFCCVAKAVVFGDDSRASSSSSSSISDPLTVVRC